MGTGEGPLMVWSRTGTRAHGREAFGGPCPPAEGVRATGPRGDGIGRGGLREGDGWDWTPARCGGCGGCWLHAVEVAGPCLGPVPPACLAWCKVHGIRWMQ